MRITQDELDELRQRYSLDSLTALDLSAEGYPQSFKDYVRLSLRFNKSTGKHGIIWKLPDASFEMVIDNKIGSLVGDSWYYKLDQQFVELKRSMLLMR